MEKEDKEILLRDLCARLPYGVKIKITYLECGGFGFIIDCNAPRIFCPFCKERVAAFSEIKEVTPMELYEILKNNFNKIIRAI